MMPGSTIPQKWYGGAIGLRSELAYLGHQIQPLTDICCGGSQHDQPTEVSCCADMTAAYCSMLLLHGYMTVLMLQHFIQW